MVRPIIRAGGLNQPSPTRPASLFRDHDGPFPTAPLTLVSCTERRYRFWGSPVGWGDGHCINLAPSGWVLRGLTGVDRDPAAAPDVYLGPAMVAGNVAPGFIMRQRQADGEPGRDVDRAGHADDPDVNALVAESGFPPDRDSIRGHRSRPDGRSDSDRSGGGGARG